MSLIGKEIADFQVDGYYNNEFIKISKADLAGKWSVFLFYPANFTFVWPTELGDLVDSYDEFQAVGCQVYSISTDSHYSHKAWHEMSRVVQKVRFPMLADPRHVLAKDFQVLVADEGIALRGSFVINPECKIMAYEVHDIPVGRTAKELLRKVHSCQFVFENEGQACPAGWHPGAPALRPGIDLVGRI